MAQLNLFKGKRQRGTAPPPPKEFLLHCMVADVVRRWLHPDFRCTHLPMGEYRDPITASRLKRMGVTPGWPDFLFVGPSLTHWLELKRRGSSTTPEQEAMAVHLRACRHSYHCTNDFNDAIDRLRDLNIISGVHPQ